MFTSTPRFYRQYRGGGTYYACNICQGRDQICLQSRKFVKHLEIDRLGSKSYLKKSRLQAYMVPSWLRLHAYLVPNEIVIAGVFGPYLDQYCRHNRFPPILEHFDAVLLLQWQNSFSVKTFGWCNELSQFL